MLWLLLCVVVVAGCGAQKVRCDKHLRPINVAVARQ